MLAEMIEALRTQALDAAAVEKFEIVDLPRKVGVRCGSTVEYVDKEPPLRDHHVRGLADLTAATLDPTISPSPEVYHDENSVRVVLDRGDRREFVLMPLENSQRFKDLVALREGKLFTSTEAVRFLRFRLSGTGVEPVIQALRRIDFTRSSSGGRTTEHGRESLGRSVEAQVQQADQVPEEFVVKVPVYLNPGLIGEHVSLRVGVDLDLDQEGIRLQTMPDEIELAITKTQARIGAALREALPEVPIFHGCA